MLCWKNIAALVSQTHRQTEDKLSDNIYGGMWIFSFSKIFYLSTRFALRGIIQIKRKTFFGVTFLSPNIKYLVGVSSFSSKSFWSFNLDF